MSSRVRPTTPFRMWESPRKVRFRKLKEGKSKFKFSAEAKGGSVKKKKRLMKTNQKTRSFLGAMAVGNSIGVQ